jgi:hypothetical protein
LLDNKPCEVNTAAELDSEIRDIFALDLVQRGDQICGTLHVYYADESVKRAILIPTLKARGVAIEWHKKTSASPSKGE